MKGTIQSSVVCLLLVSSIFIGMVNLTPSASAETGGPHDDGVFPDLALGDGIWTTDADWWIEPGDDISHSDKIIQVMGHLVVNGSLTLTNVELRMANATYDGEYNITVQSNGDLTIQDTDNDPSTTADASVIQSISGFRFGFQVSEGSRFEMKNSELNDCGWASAFPNVRGLGLFVETDWANVTGNSISNSNWGVTIWRSNNVTFADNTVNVEDWGIYADNANECTIHNNTLSGFNNFGMWIFSSTYFDISYNDVSNQPTSYGILLEDGGGHDVHNNTLSNNQIGIFLYGDGLSENLTACDINDNDISGNEDGIYIRSVNGAEIRFIFIYDNDIHSNTDDGIAIYGEDAPLAVYNVSISDNNIYSNPNGAGIYVRGQDASFAAWRIGFYNNSINNNTWGILLEGSLAPYAINNLGIFDNKIRDNDYGILANVASFSDVAGVTCRSNEVSNHQTAGYYLRGVRYMYLVDEYIANNEDNLFVRSSYNIWVENSTLVRKAGGTDIYMDDLASLPAYVDILNTTFLNSSSQVIGVDSYLNVSWYLHVNVVQWGTGVDNADVWINDTFDDPDPKLSQPLSTGTGNDGWLRWLVVNGFNRTASGTTVFTPHHIYAANGTAWGRSDPIMDMSREVTIFLNDNPLAQNLDITAASVYRLGTIYLRTNGTDVEDAENVLTPHFQYRPPGGTWNDTYIGTPAYVGTPPTGYWEASFTPPGDAPLGLYDFRVIINDTGGYNSTPYVRMDVLDVLNNPPAANAGADFTVAAGRQFNYDGTNTTDDNGTMTLLLEWDLDDSDGVNWSPPDKTGFFPLHTFSTPGVYITTLRVTDTDGAWNITTVEVTVEDIDPPVADAGPDGQVKIGSPYFFDATGSTDNVGIVWYNWSFGDGSYDNGTNATPQHIYLSQGSFQVNLTCTDAAGNPSPVDVMIITTILSNPPTADAGPDNSTDEDSPFTLDGSASTDDLGITGYFWDMDDSDGLDWTSPDRTGMVVSYTYPTPGTYTVTLNVTDNDDGWDLDTVVITVHDITNPVAYAGADDTWNEDTAYVFDGTGSTDNSGSIADYSWDFGDGNSTSISEPQPSHTYLQPGFYDVTLTVTDAEGNWDTDTMIIEILDITPPTANADALELVVDEDAPISLDGTGSYDNVGIVDYKWDMDDSDGLDWTFPDQTGVTPVHMYLMPGTYTVTLNCTDDAGLSDYDTMTIIVNDVTPPTADAGMDDIIDEDTFHTFDGSGSGDNVGVVSYKWDIDSSDGIDWANPDYTGAGPSHIYSQPGLYIATLKVSDAAGNSDTSTVAITVNDTTNPIANAGPDDTVDHNSPKTFDGTGSSDNVGIVEYEWDIYAGDGVNWLIPDYTGSTPTHTYGSPGIYTATLRATDGAGNRATDTVQITVVDVTLPTASAGPDDTVNEDQSYQFDGSGSSDDVGIVAYAWDIDNSDGVDWITPDYSEMNPTHLYTVPDIYTATIRVEDGDGNWNTDTVEITVLDITDPVASAGTDDSADEDVPYQFDGTISSDNSGSIVSYNWDFGDGNYANGSDPQPYHTFEQPDIYIVTLTVYDAAGNFHSDTVEIEVFDVTLPSADAGPDDAWDEDVPYLFDGSGSSDNVDITNYAWIMEFEDVLDWSAPDHTGITPSHTYDEPGVYIVTLNVTDSSGNWGMDTMMLTINDVTEPSADAGPDDSVDEDTAYTFNASGSSDNVGIAGYAWIMDSGDGIDWSNPDYTDSAPSHIYSEPGIYIVTLNVTDPAGNWDTDTIVITVIDTTPPVPDAGADDTLDEDIPYSFDASGSTDNYGIATYAWDMDADDGLDWADPDYENATFSHTFTEPGMYTVTLLVTDTQGNQATDTLVIEVLDVTVPSILVKYTDPMDEDVNYIFNASASTDNTGIALFNFSFGDGAFTLGAKDTASHTYNEPGTYEVTVTATDHAGNTFSETFQVTVKDTTLPSPPSGLTVSQVAGGGALDIFWIANVEADFDHYELYHSPDGITFEWLANIPRGNTSFRHAGLTNGEEYFYFIVALDTAGLESEHSDVVSGVPDTNFDGDLDFDLVDDDDDNDGVKDADDAFPYNADEWADTDGDGIGDNTDDDDDNDTVPDILDAFPQDETETNDADSDGVGDNADPDDDNDGIYDENDAFPFDPDRYEEPLDYFTLLLLLVIIVALIVAAVLGAKGRKHKRSNKELNKKVAEYEAALVRARAAPPPAAAPAPTPKPAAPTPPPWLQAKTKPAASPKAAKAPAPSVTEKPAPPETKTEEKPAASEEPVSEQQVHDEAEAPAEAEEEVMTFETFEEEPQPSPETEEPVQEPKPGETAKETEPEGPTREPESQEPIQESQPEEPAKEADAKKPRPPRPPKKKA